ncbi:MAG TPA: histidinol-phosphatase HisJ family protein [Candidatus Rifleibacterium sp.]|nr:histidinol-phosphatase HisJ family protein [Candidatus Rifleibacterium sp.]
MIKTDCHNHSNYSQDCRETPEQLIETALNRDIDVMAITDHADFAEGDSIFDPDAYLAHLHALNSKTTGLTLLCGVELGIQAEHAALCRRFVAGRPFDFIIASMHRARELDFYCGEFYKQHSTVEECWRVYLEESLRAVQAFSDFDVFGHIDIIRRYGLTRGTLMPEILQPQLDALLSWLAEHDKGLEINTSGMRYGLDSFHPHVSILRRFRQLGGRIVTIGSDSHTNKDMGADFFTALEMLRSEGFNSLATFHRRQVCFHPVV